MGKCLITKQIVPLPSGELNWRTSIRAFAAGISLLGFVTLTLLVNPRLQPAAYLCEAY